MLTGLPKTVVITSEETRRALDEPVGQIIDAIKSTLDKTPPELAADIMDRGIVLAGRGALLRRLADRLRDETQMPVQLAESPLTCVAVGSGRSLEEFEVIHRSAKARQQRPPALGPSTGVPVTVSGRFTTLLGSVPRQRTARLPVLDAPVRRGEALPRERDAHSERGSLRRARACFPGLITLHFRESDDGPLHAAQRIGVSVLMPFEVAGERVARPFRDGWGWMSDLLDAKSENESCARRTSASASSLIENQTSARAAERLDEIATYISGPRFPADFEPDRRHGRAAGPRPFTQEI